MSCRNFVPNSLIVNTLQKLPEMEGKIVWCANDAGMNSDEPRHYISNSVEDVCKFITERVKELHNKGEVIEGDDWIVDYSELRLGINGKKLVFNELLFVGEDEKKLDSVALWWWIISDEYFDEVCLKLKAEIPDLVDFSPR